MTATGLRALLLVSMFLMTACGSGGGSSPPPTAGVTAPSSLSYPSPPVLAVSQAITPLAPTVTGSVSSYSVSPSLPAGLSINQTSGTISGTPTAGAAIATYTVTASNAGGSTTATVSLMVLDSAPDIAYSETEYKFVKGIAVGSTRPTNTGGLAASWSIDNPLPTGLSFSTADGSITGTPTAVTQSATYIISAANAIGTDTIALTIAVASGVLIDLGHVSTVTGIDYEGNRVLSHDSVGHWVLWNVQTGEPLSQGETACDFNAPGDCRSSADIAGPTMVLNTRTGLQVRASSDGSELATITTAYNWWQLALDGSYVAAANSAGLTVWTPDGSILFSKSGDYSTAKAFAAASELRVVGGAQGVNVLERIAVPMGSSTSSGPLQGQAHSWFLDGERFITNVGNTIWVYSAAGVQQDFKAMTHIQKLTGQGDWFWTFTNDGARGLDVYEVGSSALAVNFPLPSAFNGASAQGSGESILLSFGDGDHSVIDLSAAAPTKIDYSDLPHTGISYAALSSTDWVNGDSDGVVTQYGNGTPRYFSEGRLHGLAVGETRIAIATAADKIHLFDAETFDGQGSIDFGTSGVDISADGTVLLARPEWPASTVKIFALPSGIEIASYAPPSGGYASVSLSPSGQEWTSARAVGIFNGLTTYLREIRSVTSGSLLWSDTGSTSSILRVSPSGESIAAPDSSPGATTGTNIFANNTLVGATVGFPLGWVDEDRLLVIRYTNGVFGKRYLGSYLVDGTGLQVSSPALPELSQVVPVSHTSIYSPVDNLIYSLATGQSIWSSPNPVPRNVAAGGVTGTHVVFYSGTAVRAEPY